MKLFYIKSNKSVRVYCREHQVQGIVNRLGIALPWLQSANKYYWWVSIPESVWTEFRDKLTELKKEIGCIAVDDIQQLMK
jgi:hypothetical protein